MTGLLLGAAVYLVALAKWPGALAVCVLVALGWNRLGKAGLLIAGSSIIAAGWISAALPEPVHPASQAGESWHLLVTSMPQQRSNGWDFAARILEGPAANRSVLVHSTDRDALTVGARVFIRGTVAPSTQSDPVLDYLAGMGVGGEIYTSEVIVAQPGQGPIAWLNRWRNATVHEIQTGLPGDAGALVAGFVTGDDGHLSLSSEGEFRSAGLSHLTAVSGANLAMLLTLIGIVTYWQGRTGLSMLMAGTVLLWGYAMFVGLPPPTLRAALLATLAAGGRSVGRPIDLVALTLLTIPMQMAIRPTDAYSVSFHLSVVASFGLAAGFSRYPRNERRHGLPSLLTATAFAQLATLPIIIAVFRSAPLLSVLANIAAAPFAGFAFATGIAGSLALPVSQRVGSALLIPAGWSADVVLTIADLYGRPWSVLDVADIGDTSMIALTLISAIVLLGVSGELALIRRQFRRHRRIMSEPG